MEAERIYNFASCAVNTIMGRRYWDEDRDDARQEAALYVLLAERRGLDRSSGFYYTYAKYGVLHWIEKFCRRNRDTIPLSAWVERMTAANTSTSEAMLRNLDSLAPLLRGQRVHNSQNVDQEIALEVAYCRLMLEGYSIEETAAKLGRTRRNTESLRERIVPRLRMIAEGRKPVRRFAMPSLEGLRRLERDPEALRRRNEAISRAKRGRRVQ